MKPMIRSEGLTVVELDQEAVIYDEAGGRLHYLNPTAALVFSLCDGSATVRELSTEIAAAYGLTVDDVERQVRALIRDFREVGLLHGSRAAPNA